MCFYLNVKLECKIIAFNEKFTVRYLSETLTL